MSPECPFWEEASSNNKPTCHALRGASLWRALYALNVAISMRSPSYELTTFSTNESEEERPPSQARRRPRRPRRKLKTNSMHRWARKAFYTFLALCLFYVLLTAVIAILSRNKTAQQRLENEEWISSSTLWIDRQLCRWIGCCGTLHMLDHSGWTWPTKFPRKPPRDPSQFWHSGTETPENWSDEERGRRTVPEYVLEHAPYVHLFSSETYWPSDIAEHLVHTRPILNHSAIDYESADTHDLNNLDRWDSMDEDGRGNHVFLHSYDNIETLPDWLTSQHNIPASLERQVAYDYVLSKSSDGRCGGLNGTTCQGTPYGQCCSIFGWCGFDRDHCSLDCDPRFGHCQGPHLPGRYEPRTDLKKRSLSDRGKSTAPAVLVLVPKPDNIVDAFWFFFYSYNKGKKVLNIQFGNHVGDWEHTMIRFQNGTPIAAFLSAHSWGASYTYDALEKYALNSQTGELLSSARNATAAPPEQFKRPIVFSAEGSHAMYPTPDYHDYVAPYGILHDDTDRGPLWDPLMNLKSFTYDVDADVVRSSTLNPDAPTSWFNYAGHWGDRYYLLSDPRQYRFAGEYHYVSGPSGPKFKNLGRKEPCERQGACKVATSIQRIEPGGMIHM